MDGPDLHQRHLFERAGERHAHVVRRTRLGTSSLAGAAAGPPPERDLLPDGAGQDPHADAGNGARRAPPGSSTVTLWTAWSASTRKEASEE